MHHFKHYCHLFQEKNFTYYVGDGVSFDDQRYPLQNNQEFNKALTVHAIENDVTVYKIHRYFCQEELKITRQELEKEKEAIIKIAPKTPAGEKGLTWPIGNVQTFIHELPLCISVLIMIFLPILFHDHCLPLEWKNNRQWIAFWCFITSKLHI